MPSIDAYHGTIKTSAEKILDSKEFTAGAPRDDHWLGKGAYFFRDDKESAKMWAITKIRKTPELSHETPCVLFAKIDVPDENFLDLDSREGMYRLKTLTKEFTGIKLKGDTPRGKTAEQIRHLVMTWLPESIWVIQRTFPVPSIAFDESILFKAMAIPLNSRQVCVRNSKAIIRDTIDCVYPPKEEIVHGNEILLRKRKKPRFLG